MAVLSHFPSFLSLVSNKPFAAPLPSSKTGHSIHHLCHLTHRHGAILASSIKQPRKGKKGRSNADICRDIREFVSAAGLPEDHIPSVKELSQHGRQDLANIVRRRGYKLVKYLLETSEKSDEKESDTEPDLSGNQDVSVKYEDDSAGQVWIKKVEEMDEVDFSLSEVTVKQNHLDSAKGDNMDGAVNSDRNGCKAIECSSNSSLHVKVADFIQNGELELIEEDGFGILHEIGADGGNEFDVLENVKNECSSLSEERSEWVLHKGDTTKIINGGVSSSKRVVVLVSGTNTPRDYNLSGGGLLSANCDEELDNQTIKKNQSEVNRLKFLLHQKELELSRLKEQIEKEKLALSFLQTKAETEVSKAQKLVLEKDAELHAMEGNLAGLVEVEIQYKGDGDAVEVAGSFNGWHHRITMDPQSSITDPIGSRKSRLWTTALWLYPGTYEIKFIVDGNWRIDPQRESVTKGTIENNILRVDR